MLFVRILPARLRLWMLVWMVNWLLVDDRHAKLFGLLVFAWNLGGKIPKEGRMLRPTFYVLEDRKIF